MKVDTDAPIDDAVIAFQLIDVQLLNEILRKRGIPSRQRQSICAEYMHDFYMYLDQMSFECNGRELFPKLYFAESDRESGGGILAPNALHTGADDPLSYCEYAIATVTHFFKDLRQKADPKRRLG